MRTRHSLSLLVTTLIVAAGPASRTVTCADLCSGQVSAITVRSTGAVYTPADLTTSTAGFFQTGQDADIMLSGIDFNNTGGGLLFNHQSGIASDGTRLLVSDTFNNRVLIWKTLPAANVAPDLVLGQKNLTTNDPGSGRDQMNWPFQVSTDGQRVVVADTRNHRVLIWNSFPTQSGAPADVVIEGRQIGSKAEFMSGWGAWTNGTKLVATNSVPGQGKILIWNRLPTADNTVPDVVLSGNGIGTPRQVMSDGTRLAVGDHNASVPGKSTNLTHFWKTFPTADTTPPDFVMEDPANRNSDTWMTGTIASDGRLIVMGSTLMIWNSFPTDANDGPDVTIAGFAFRPGDYAGVAFAGGRVYVSSGNFNKILVYNTVPTSSTRMPDFAIGAPDLCTNSLETNYFMTNPTPLSDGKSLWVASSYEQKMWVWRNIPDGSGAAPDIVYDFPLFAAWGAALSGHTLALAGGPKVYVWDTLPLGGELPSRTLEGRIGSITLRDVRGVAIDERYFYLADQQANKVYVWAGVPASTSEPVFSLDVASPGSMSSDGTYLTVTQSGAGKVLIYSVSALGSTSIPATITARAPTGALATRGRLFIADWGYNGVLTWSDIRTAAAGQQADIILGRTNFSDTEAQIGRNKMFQPGQLFFDGRYLWVGELKFANRLLRFRPPPGAPANVQAGVNGSTLNVSWSVPSSAPTPSSYRLDFSSGDTVVASATVGAVSTTAFAIPPGTRGTFTVTVTAFSGSTTAPPTSPVTFTIAGSGCTTAPPAPTGLSGGVAAGTATVRWNASEGATSYVVQAGSVQGASNVFNGNVGDITSVSASGLAPGFRAFVRVIAVNSCGQSAPTADFLLQ